MYVAQNFQNLQSHVNTPESIAADNIKKQTNNASNTPTLTRKHGREISHRTRTNSQNTTTTVTTVNSPKQQSNMTAKSAGSGTLSRSNNVNSLAVTTPPSSTAPLNNNKARTRELRNNSVRRSSEDRLLKRPQSPPTKRNDSPTGQQQQQQPAIMLDSVQRKIQNELSDKKKTNDSDVDSAIEDDESDNDDENCDELDDRGKNISKLTNNKPMIEKFSSPPTENNDKFQTQLAELKEPVTTNEEESYKEEEKNTSKILSQDEFLQQQQEKARSQLPSPPITPAATDVTTPELAKARVSETGSSNVHIYSEPASPTMYAFEVPAAHNYRSNDMDSTKQDASHALFTQQQQQSIHRIQRLRPAASFATLRQLASTNNTYQLQQQQYQQQQQQQQQQLQAQYPQQPIRTYKRRPVSYIDSSSYSSLNYTNDDYLTVNRPTCYRRASSEDNRHLHAHEQSDNASVNTASSFPFIMGGRGLIRSNTIHNLIIKDGEGHRIVQCMGLDEPPILRRKGSSFEGKDLFQQPQHQQLQPDWSPPSETLDDMYFSARQLEEQQYHQEQLLLIQQQQQQSQQQQQQQQQLHHSSNMNDNNTDTSSSDSGSQHTGYRRIKRKDSAKSISSLCSSSPPITSYDSRFEKLRNKLEKERATVKALQKQKEGW